MQIPQKWQQPNHENFLKIEDNLISGLSLHTLGYISSQISLLGVA